MKATRRMLSAGFDLAGPKICLESMIPMQKHGRPSVPEQFDPDKVRIIGKTHVHRELKEMRERARVLRFTTPPSRANRRYALGYVPTMGALHDGHMALIEASQAECVFTCVSIFVNPTQFSTPEEAEQYPSHLERDLRILAEAGVDSVFLPTKDQLYPPGFKLFLNYEGIEEHAEGKSRDGHFKGVATVCNKLFNLVLPNMVYIGQKDALQCVVLRALIRDYNMDMGLTVCPTVRDIDGLAMSSRNERLTEEQKEDAPGIFEALTQVNEIAGARLRSSFRGGEAPYTAGTVRDMTTTALKARISMGEIDYVSVGEKEDMSELADDAPVVKGTFVSVVVRYGDVRLLDVVRIGHTSEEYWTLNARVF